jgi:hypothetical protein
LDETVIEFLKKHRRVIYWTLGLGGGGYIALRLFGGMGSAANDGSQQGDTGDGSGYLDPYAGIGAGYGSGLPYVISGAASPIPGVVAPTVVPTGGTTGLVAAQPSVAATSSPLDATLAALQASIAPPAASVASPATAALPSTGEPGVAVQPAPGPASHPSTPAHAAPAHAVFPNVANLFQKILPHGQGGFITLPHRQPPSTPQGPMGPATRQPYISQALARLLGPVRGVGQPGPTPKPAQPAPAAPKLPQPLLSVFNLHPSLPQLPPHQGTPLTSMFQFFRPKAAHPGSPMGASEPPADKRSSVFARQALLAQGSRR